MDYKTISKETIGFLYQSHASIRKSGLDNKLIALAELRVSQLNGCAYCCSFHSNELRQMGINQDILDKLPGWKHSKAFDPVQELVLLWAEAVTLMQDDLQRIREKLGQHFSEKEVVDLTASISLMNALNRLRITLGEKD
ncbi:carboxymuconolactone decarboxylase family protein [Chitinophaga flava]|uniref:Carboxymuconolactone decarboxylase family protein n=1 Tax=Chitinophaga flava TaxID=2259036 RepID=A0A365Y2J0_9BACT|nr:carboxymuconolactone decarboxylase family protein [Chitinophaga flava]RBL92461.1 carboxymuconolactone decarboxylase family protein [Chitinophaga flava]